MLDAVGTTVYTYASGGELFTEDGPFASDTVTNVYLYRQRVGLGLQQPTGRWTNSFGYDTAKRLTSVGSPAGAFGYTYDAQQLGLVDKVTLPTGSIITNHYDGSARLLATWLKTSGGTVLDAATYGYNALSQRTTVTNAAGTNVAYQYDPLGQLTVATSSTALENRGYSYDAAWNLNRVTNHSGTITLLVDGLNQLITNGASVFTYDANGNLTSQADHGNTVTYGYDDENRLARILSPSGNNQTTFVYDGLGRLREQLYWVASGGDGGTGGGSSSAALPRGLSLTSSSSSSGSWTLLSGLEYIYDGNRVIQERDTNNTPTVSYTRGKDLSGSLEGAGGIGGLLARSGNFYSGNFTNHNYYHADGNGNITYLETASQGLAASYRYDSYGNLLASSGALAATNSYQFSSKESFTAYGTTLYYYLYRFYSPGWQRWMSRDPLGEPGFETIHLVKQPLLIKKIRLGINNNEMKLLLAEAMQNGKIDIGDYLRNSDAHFTGKSISAKTFLDILKSRQENYAPNWPVELLENPNLFDFLGNDALNGVDPFGNGFLSTLENLIESIVEGIKTAVAEMGSFLDGPKCLAGAAANYSNEKAVQNVLTNDDITMPTVPLNDQ